MAFDRKATTESIIDTPERVKIQNEAVEILDYNAGHSKYEDRLFTGKPNAEKKIVFVMGKPGSGKSVIEAIPLVKKLKAILVDVDEAKKLFPEYDGGKGAGVVHEESSKVSAKLVVRSVEKNYNMVYPVVGKDFDTLLGKISLFKDKGYKVYLHNIDIPGDESYRRAFVRYLNSGRLIPHEYLLSIGDNPNIVYNQLKKIGVLDGYKKTDNFVKRGEKPILIENEGGITIGEKSINTSPKRIQKSRAETATKSGTEEKSIELSEDQKLINEFKDEEFSVSSRVEEEEIVADMITAKQALEDINNDQAIINRLRDCVV